MNSCPVSLAKPITGRAVRAAMMGFASLYPSYAIALRSLTEDDMFDRIPAGALVLAASLLLGIAGAQAHDESKYPDWAGMWRRPPGVGIQWDETKRPGL